MRLVSARGLVEGACVLLAGPLSAKLAGMPLESAAFIGAAIAFSAVPAAFFWLAEPRVAGVKHSILSDGLQEFRTIAGARSVWIAALFLLCVCLPQTFPTVLYFHQTTTLKFPVADIGYLNAASGVGNLLAPVIICACAGALSRAACCASRSRAAQSAPRSICSTGRMTPLS